MDAGPASGEVAVEREVKALVRDGEARQRMKEALAEVRGMLRGELTADSTLGSAGESAAYRAARAILRVAESVVLERE